MVFRGKRSNDLQVLAYGKGLVFHLSHPFVAVGFAMLYSGTALLLCSENLLLELRETVGLWLAPCLAFFLLSL